MSKINGIEQGLKLVELKAAEILSQTGEVPYEVISRLGLATEIKPGNPWLGIPDCVIAKLGDKVVSVANPTR